MKKTKISLLFTAIIFLVAVNMSKAQGTVSGGSYGNNCNSASTFACLNIVANNSSDVQLFYASFSKENGLTVTFKKDELNSSFKKMLKTGFLVVKKNETLHDELCQALGCSKGFTVGKGKYRWEKYDKKEGTYTIILGLSVVNETGSK